MQGDVETLGRIAGAVVVGLAMLPLVVSLVMRSRGRRTDGELAVHPVEEETARPDRQV